MGGDVGRAHADIDEQIEALTKAWKECVAYDEANPVEGEAHEARARVFETLAAKLCALDDEKRLGLVLCIGGCYGKTLPEVAARCWQRDGEYWRCPECSPA
jgi:hypothetical protein